MPACIRVGFLPARYGDTASRHLLPDERHRHGEPGPCHVVSSSAARGRLVAVCHGESERLRCARVCACKRFLPGRAACREHRAGRARPPQTRSLVHLGNGNRRKTHMLLMAGMAALLTAGAFGGSDVDALARMWPGIRDSSEQLFAGTDASVSPWGLGTERRVRTVVAAVSVPWLGPHVLYLEEFLHDDPDNL